MTGKEEYLLMAENTDSSCPQRDSVEHEGYAEALKSFSLIWKERDSAQPKERLIYGGFYDLATAYQSVYVNY